MRRLSIPVALIVLLGLAIPAWAAQPTADHVVTWSVAGGTVTLDTDTGLVVLAVATEMPVQCGGASLIAEVELSGEALATDITIDKQGRSGTFSVTSDQLTISILGGCNDVTTDTLSGTFEANKGKADDRGRSGSDRIIQRSGSGSFDAGMPFMENADVAIVTTIGR